MADATNQQAPDTRACDECGKLQPYEPVIMAGRDMFAGFPFTCEPCDAAQAREEARKKEKQKHEARRQLWLETIPERYRETDIEHPEFNKRLWHLVEKIPIGQKLVLIGPAGRCKTRIMALKAKQAILAGHRVAWCNANEFQDAAQTKFDKRDGAQARENLREWKRAGVLFIDDLGKHNWTETVEAAFYDLLEAREAHNRPTHWSLNPHPADIISRETLEADAAGILQRGLDPSGNASARARFAPILSRLQDGVTLIPFP